MNKQRFRSELRICRKSDTYTKRNKRKGQAAEVSGSMKIREKEMIAIDPGHGDMKMRR